MQTFVVTTIDELAAVAVSVKNQLAALPTTPATVLTLRGDLGAGKTAFVQCLGRSLGVTEQIVSPTFVVMKMYETSDERFATLVHMDAYRIESEAEVAPLRLGELLEQSHTLCCIEWAERIAGVLPAVRTELAISETDGVRTITMTHHGY
jgi:tRNA threonylcarbamoyladenosine biosynthesis protein TsaE